ncbi:hypothetical protein KM043_015440 [Ampulex compressa]|nr:hypothetical protein KM043_015440 [Ampulex compressa]
MNRKKKKTIIVCGTFDIRRTTLAIEHSWAENHWLDVQGPLNLPPPPLPSFAPALPFGLKILSYSALYRFGTGFENCPSMIPYSSQGSEEEWRRGGGEFSREKVRPFGALPGITRSAGPLAIPYSR